MKIEINDPKTVIVKFLVRCDKVSDMLLENCLNFINNHFSLLPALFGALSEFPKRFNVKVQFYKLKLLKASQTMNISRFKNL